MGIRWCFLKRVFMWWHSEGDLSHLTVWNSPWVKNVTCLGLLAMLAGKSWNVWNGGRWCFCSYLTAKSSEDPAVEPTCQRCCVDHRLHTEPDWTQSSTTIICFEWMTQTIWEKSHYKCLAWSCLFLSVGVGMCFTLSAPNEEAILKQRVPKELLNNLFTLLINTLCLKTAVCDGS